METITLNVQGMSCGHCVKAVEDNVKPLEGVEAVNVSLEQATVEVSFDASKVSQAAIEEAIEDQGYDVV